MNFEDSTHLSSPRGTNAPAGRHLIVDRSFSVRIERVRATASVYRLRLESADGTNRLTQTTVLALKEVMCRLAANPRPLVICGSERFFSAGADLTEIAALHGVSAREFARLGQELMLVLESFPAPVCVAISGYCMGGGLDLALACHRRIAAPNAIFGHRGTALGLMTGWGGTQRLSRLIGEARALEIFMMAEKVSAAKALQIGLIHSISDDPVQEALRWVSETSAV